jgi:hypothetical protein
MEGIKKFTDVLNKSNSELTFREKCRKLIGVIVIGLLGVILIVFINKSKERKAIEQEKRNKLKYFKPSIEEGLFSNRITWVMRDEPLSDEFLDEFLKEIK